MELGRITLNSIGRELITLAVFSVVLTLIRPTYAQVVPFKLKLVRDYGLAELVDQNECIRGKLYLVQSFEMSDPAGTLLGDTIELPWRNDENDISAISPGRYPGHVHTDGDRGWRIELEDTGKRLFIQIHPGNTTDDIRGCILVGKQEEPDSLGIPVRKRCRLSGSRDAMDRIKELYNSPQATRPIEILIEE